MALARAAGDSGALLHRLPAEAREGRLRSRLPLLGGVLGAGLGWVPVDASDAAKTKEPVKKAYLFGNLDPDRFDITTGRDLTLSPPQKDGPLNFFIYPYVEVDGKAFAETKIRLEYRDL